MPTAIRDLKNVLIFCLTTPAKVAMISISPAAGCALTHNWLGLWFSLTTDDKVTYQNLDKLECKSRSMRRSNPKR